MNGLTIERKHGGDSGERYVLGVGGDLTIPFAGEFRGALLEALDQAGSVEVDVSGVSAVDITGLQLLCSAHRAACTRQKGFFLTGRDNPVFAESVGLAGFERHVGCSRDVGKNCIWIGGDE
ncbi:STAS domain-containing protein [Geobacter sulfurreducens]|uniref:STAS domain-containing protein n=1 Tax=Geobacter sulfurreducens TaxID=35554 RepID=UPI0020B7797E|nr:STAS domain-containing protein [Geobacter sulfurreducens]UTG93953.1 STAS domain-containing protein [Geobacter sulfurreducens]